MARPVARKEPVGLVRAEGVEEEAGVGTWVHRTGRRRCRSAGDRGRANQRAGDRKRNVPGKRGVPQPESPFVDRKKAAQAEEWLSSSLGTANVLS